MRPRNTSTPADATPAKVAAVTPARKAHDHIWEGIVAMLAPWVTTHFASAVARLARLITELEADPQAEPNLEQGRGGADVTHPTTLVAHGRREDGATYPFTPTTMSRLITTCIPIHQPDGRLAIPPDDWAHLRAVVEDEGGTLDLEETTKRGFIFGGHHGLPVYSVAITLPDEVDAVAAMHRIDPALKEIVRRNLTPEPQEQPA